MLIDTGIAPGTGPRLLTPRHAGRESLAEYRRLGGYSTAGWAHSLPDLLDLVEASGLRGRGGAGFPAGRKWRSVAAEPGLRVVLVNGAESEPASRKDHWLLTHRPHLVIEGALLGARAVGASEIVFYLHTVAQEARAAIEAAWRELAAERRSLPRRRIVVAPPGYVAGEQSAAIQRANGKKALPTFKPPRAHQQGVGGRPTLVHNVETLANVPFIARQGADAFRSVGIPTAPGTMLLTLSGAVRRPGVYEVPSGVQLAHVLDELGGGTVDGGPIQAVLPGGYFAGWLNGAALHGGVALSAESLRDHGVELGSGAITVVSDGVCGLAQAVALLHFFARESARQCGPCAFGTPAMAAALERLARGRAEDNDVPRLRRYAEVVLPGRGACSHLDGATIAARTALHVFAEEIAQHARYGGCGRPERVVLPGLEDDDAQRAA